MKMDIEGAEVFAINGLRESLRNMRIKRLLLELHPVQLLEHGSSTKDIIETLQEAGYKALTIDHSLSVTRYAAYGKNVDVAELLRPLNVGDQLDAWPHHLWLAPCLT